jgi:malate dehydrogenase
LALDLQESGPIEGFDVEIIGTNDFEDTRNSDVVAITAGDQRKPGQSREELLLVNADIVKNLAQQLAQYSPRAVMIVVTNPLDTMAYLAYKVSKFAKNKVVGMAGILDSSRFRIFIAEKLKVSIEDVSAPVLGGHGDFMVPLPNHTSVNGIPLTQLLPKEEIDKIVERTRNAGAEIISLGGSSAFYAPASSLVQMIEAVIKDKKRILPCAAYLEGEYGLFDVFIGVPVKLGSNGIEDVIELELTKEEMEKLKKSAEKIKESIEVLKRKDYF